MRLVKIDNRYINPDQVVKVEPCSIYLYETQIIVQGVKIVLTSIHSGNRASTSDYIETQNSMLDVVRLLKGDIDELVELR